MISVHSRNSKRVFLVEHVRNVPGGPITLDVYSGAGLNVENLTSAAESVFPAVASKQISRRAEKIEVSFCETDVSYQPIIRIDSDRRGKSARASLLQFNQNVSVVDIVFFRTYGINGRDDNRVVNAMRESRRSRAFFIRIIDIFVLIVGVLLTNCILRILRGVRIVRGISRGHV